MKKNFFILFLLFSTLLSAVEGEFYINGQIVKSISLSLGVTSIDFGDVYIDTVVDSVPVDFYVDAEAGVDYMVEISNDDSSGVLQVSRTFSGGYTGDTISYDDIGTGSDQAHEFYVNMDTSSIADDLTANITVMVVYLEIIE